VECRAVDVFNPRCAKVSTLYGEGHTSKRAIPSYEQHVVCCALCRCSSVAKFFFGDTDSDPLTNYVPLVLGFQRGHPDPFLITALARFG